MPVPRNFVASVQEGKHSFADKCVPKYNLGTRKTVADQKACHPELVEGSASERLTQWKLILRQAQDD